MEWRMYSGKKELVERYQENVTQGMCWSESGNSSWDITQ
jgi:hypothetical protein